MIRYAVVPTPGMYGSGSHVTPVRVSRTLDAALRYAARCTREYQRAMAPHGGSSGGYRVVECDDASPVWYGHELDSTPEVSR